MEVSCCSVSGWWNIGFHDPADDLAVVEDLPISNEQMRVKTSKKPTQSAHLPDGPNKFQPGT